MTSNDTTTLIRSEGIFHGLPVLPANLKGFNAIVVGASGTSGQPLIDILGRHPDRWEKLYALSRKPPVTAGLSNVEHVPVDLLWDSGKISAAMREHNVKADFVFYFGYVQLTRPEDSDSAIFGDPEHLAKVNEQIFQSFLNALNDASIRPKRIVLQTGGKNYGVHLGHVNVPLREGAPRVELEPNFYYNMEDSLKSYLRSQHQASYNIAMPQWILGAVAGTDMTIFYPLAVYAAMQRKLNRPLLYPGDLVYWDNRHPIATGLLNGRFYEWLVLSPHTAGESFNITDGSDFTFGGLWPVMASWFQLQWEPPREDAKYTEIEMPHRPRGYGPKGKLRTSFSLIDWAREPAVRKAWDSIKQEHGLTTDPFEDPEKTFSFLQFALALTWSWQTSMDKARKFGWFGHCDSVEALREVFEKFGQMKMIPPLSQ